VHPVRLIATAIFLAFALGGVTSVWLGLAWWAAPSVRTDAAAISVGSKPLTSQEPPQVLLPATVLPASTPSGNGPGAPTSALPATASQPAPPPPLVPPKPPEAASAPQAPLPAEVASSAAPRTRSEGRGAYLLRFGVFQEPSSAAQLQAELKRHGYAADVVQTFSNGKTLQLVELGGFPDRSAAAEAAASVRREVAIGALLMKSPTQ
jgi:cell division septation protein DedD